LLTDLRLEQDARAVLRQRSAALTVSEDLFMAHPAISAIAVHAPLG